MGSFRVVTDNYEGWIVQDNIGNGYGRFEKEWMAEYIKCCLDNELPIKNQVMYIDRHGNPLLELNGED